MIKSKEQISIEKKAYYLENRDKILARYKKRMYDLRSKNRIIPFVTFAMNDSDLLPEHAFEFIGDDISKKRFAELIAMYHNNGIIDSETRKEALGWEKEMEGKGWL